MMKRTMLMTLGLSLVAGQAFASKARLEALGEDAYGSQFIDDARNAFLNASTINNHKDYVTYEWGQTTNATDAAATPRAEGGFFRSTGNMVYGVYLGSESNTSNALRQVAGLATTDGLMEENVWDFFIGGDAGWQWGASLTYTSTQDETNSEAKQSATRGRFGFGTGPWSGFVNFGITNKAETTATEFDGKSSYDLGVTYGFRGNLDLMGRVSGINAEQKITATGTTKDFTSSEFRIGLAKRYRVNSKANVWVSGFYRSLTSDCEFTGGGCTDALAASGIGNGELKRNYLPLSVAAEVMVKSWLTVRGSVSQSLMGEYEYETSSHKETVKGTTVNAGASLHFDDFQIDGLIGNSSDADATGQQTIGSDTSAGEGVLRTDSIMSRVSMTYRF